MSKGVRLADIAKRLNVSTVTVSNALAGQKGVSEEMRLKIKEMADEMGYKPPSGNGIKRAKKTFNLGVLISEKYLDEYTTFYWSMYQQLAQVAVEQGCFTLVEVLKQEDEANPALPMFISEEKVDGMIIIGQLSRHYLSYIRENTKVPLLFLDFYEESTREDSVIGDNFYGMYLMTTYLIKKGHKDIAYLGTVLANSSITDRYFGYHKAMLEHGLTIRPEWVINDRLESGEIDIILPEQLPTAFVCNCDLVASELIKIIREKNHQVPNDISVVGYDNFLHPGLCDVGITTYEVDIQAMAKVALKRILARINGGSDKKPGLHIVAGHMIEKESVVPLD